MPLERVRLVLLGLTSLVMAAAGMWMLLGSTDWHDKSWGAVGVLFFGIGGAALLRSATKDQVWLQRQVRTPARSRPFIAPVLLLFSLPWSLKLWVCLPLLVARAALLPRYDGRRALLAACGLAVAIALGQAILAVLAARDTDPSDLSILLPQLGLSAIVLVLDFRLLWAVRLRLREPAAAQEELVRSL